jgi:acyl-CoA synthetase (AMP-forming)/AMP-acid ligase II
VNNVLQIKEGAAIHDKSFSGSWMPLTHDMGLVGFHITTLCSNINQLLMEPRAFIRNPKLFFQKVMLHRITHIGLPNFSLDWILKMVKDSDAEFMDLSSLCVILNGSEPINYELIQRFQDKFSKSGLKDNAMFPVYGMAEACVAVTFPEVNSSVRVCRPPVEANILNVVVSVGRPLSGMELTIVDNDNNTVRQNEIGEILIKGPNVTSGYYKNDNANKELFYNGYLRTGDLGFIRQNNLYITGRKKDVFFINGQNYYLNDIDVALKESGIKNAVSAYCDSDNSIYVFLKSSGNTDKFDFYKDEINKILLKKYNIQVKRVVAVSAIPKTTSGKIKRYSLLENYIKNKEGNIDEVYKTVGK